MKFTTGINRAISSPIFGWLIIGTGVILTYKATKAANNIITNTAIQISGATLNYNQINNIANQIKGAWGILNDDEEAIYNAFSKLNNQKDFEYLVKVYEYGTIFKENLFESITKRMNAKERAKINNILSLKGIQANF